MINTPNINIINTYVPEMSVCEETCNKHLAETREITNQIPKNNVIFWRTYNNGQLAQDDENYEQVGKWTM